MIEKILLAVKLAHEELKRTLKCQPRFDKRKSKKVSDSSIFNSQPATYEINFKCEDFSKKLQEFKDATK